MDGRWRSPEAHLIIATQARRGPLLLARVHRYVEIDRFLDEEYLFTASHHLLILHRLRVSRVVLLAHDLTLNLFWVAKEATCWARADRPIVGARPRMMIHNELLLIVC